MPEAILALILIAVAIGAFVLAVRVGILIGVRLDRTIEARHAADTKTEAAGAAAEDSETAPSEEAPGND